MPGDRNRKLPRKEHRYVLAMFFVWLMFFLSLSPTVLLCTAATVHTRVERNHFIGNLPLIGKVYQAADKWYSDYVSPVEELRVLAPFPPSWQGHWYNFDSNYVAFESWYGDN